MLPDERRADLDDSEGVLGRVEKRFRLVVRLFLKLLGGGLGASPALLISDDGDNGGSNDSRRSSRDVLRRPSNGCVSWGFSSSHLSNFE